jgi:hypothetical protein
MKSRRAVAALLTLTVIVCARAAPADEELSAWVSADTGLCLEIRNLADHARRFAAGPFARRFSEFPPIADALQQYRPWLATVAGEVERRSGAKIDEIFTELLGRHVLFAVWPPRGDADQGAALVLVEATDTGLLERSLERLVAARKQARRWLGRRTLTVAGVTYEADVVQPDDRHADFYLVVVDSVAVIATSESLLSDVLSRRAGAAAKEPPPLNSIPEYQASAASISDAAVARLFINPRAWDAALAADLRKKPADSEEARSQQFVIDAWRTMDYVVAGVEIEPRLAIEIAWHWNADALPEPARFAVEGLCGRSKFVDRIPADALLAVAGRVDPAPLARHLIAAHWLAGGRATAGSNTEPAETPWQSLWAWALAPGWGPEFSAYCTRRPSNADAEGPAAGWPLTIVIGVESRPLTGDGPPLASMVEPWLGALLSAAVDAANSRAGHELASIESLTVGDLGLKLVTGLVPGQPGRALVYAVAGNCFWLATSAAELRHAVSLSRTEALTARPAFREQLGKLAEPSDLIYLDLSHWRELLSAAPDAADFLSEGQSLDASARTRQRQTLLAISRLADRAIFGARIDKTGVSLSFSLAADAASDDAGD